MAYAIGNAGSDTESKADPLVDSRRGGDVASFTANRWMVHFPGSTQAYVSSKWPEALARSAIEDALVFGAKAVKADPQGVEACGLMADALASAKAPETVFWRARVALLQPDKLENLTWAQAAFDVGRSDWAAEALAKAPNTAQNRADWQNLMGGAQNNLGHFGEAEQHFQRAVWRNCERDIAILPIYS